MERPLNILGQYLHYMIQLILKNYNFNIQIYDYVYFSFARADLPKRG